MGDHGGAVEDFTQAARLDPNHVEAYIDRADARRAFGDQDGALADLQIVAGLLLAQSRTAEYQRVRDVISTLQQ
jgi:serine/threonine-protein kinase